MEGLFVFKMWMALVILFATPLFANEAGTSIEAHVVGYVEVPFNLKMGDHYDHRELTRPLQATPPAAVASRPPSPHIVPIPAPTAQEVPLKMLESSWDVTSSSSQIPANADLAVGPAHVVAVASTGVFVYNSQDGSAISGTSLASFFSALSPGGSVEEPSVLYDDFRDRYVVIAGEVDPAAPNSALLVAVSATNDPGSSWQQVRVPTLLANFDPDGPGPLPASPHYATVPRIGMEASQIYVSFLMASTQGGRGGTAVWNLWKDPLYGGGNVTIQAGIRPFSAGNDYDNEVALRPVRFYGNIVDDVIDRGVFLAGYDGMSVDGVPTLQIFWLTTVGPSVTKFVVSLPGVDSLVGGVDLPDVPQRDSPVAVSSGRRSIYSAVWQDGELWLVTTVVPPTGADAGEVTAYWVELQVPSPTFVALQDQGQISGDALVPEAHTFFPSLDISPDGLVAIGYSISAPNLELSSVLSFVGPNCDSAQVVLAPIFLRRGTAVWPTQTWGTYSGTAWDDGLCFWHHNSHPIGGAMPTWRSSVGKFCLDPGTIFEDGFEAGDVSQWCSSTGG
ncbi:MAG: hypothetical protein AAGM22_07550 [Acidobacteriota bacterium]